MITKFVALATVAMASSVALANQADSVNVPTADALPAASEPDSAPAVTTSDDYFTGGEHYFSLLGGFIHPSKTFGLANKHAPSFSGIYGYQFSDHFSGELNLQGSIEHERHNGANLQKYQYGVTFDAVYSLFDRRKAALTPYALLGAGPIRQEFDPYTRNGTALTLEAGAGLVSGWLFHDTVRLRLEGRYLRDFRGGKDANEYRGLFGFEIPIGRVEHVKSLLMANEQPRVVEVIKEVKRPWIDSDGDGVDDEHDKCPDTPKGLKVDSDGCIIPGQKIELRGVTFEYNKARLTLNAKTVLDLITKAFVGQRTLKVEIAGHTDSHGTARYNQRLSQRRAESVRDYLVSNGASAEQLTAKGYGKSELLINPERSENDREANRRVEFRVLEK